MASWDIFCTVVDNYGDIGITWRLARQLVAERGCPTRLWVDDLESFRRIQPAVDPVLASQMHAGVEIRRWCEPFPDCQPADVVVEAFACQVPASYERAMANRAVKPVWLNLEYLTAEDWATGVHGLPSPHPRLPLTKFFFMPGYVAGTGGLLKETWLEGERNAFQGNPSAQAAFWQALGVPPKRENERRISLFSYENTAIASLLEAWAGDGGGTRCLVPSGKSLGDVAAFFGKSVLAPGDVAARGNLVVQVLPMLDMDDYDRLLWACDANFVRGEDSFVRAQWAGKPLVWQAYRQEDGAHWPKIEAFLALFRSGLDGEAWLAQERLWHLWNAGEAVGMAWTDFWRHREVIRAHLVDWQASISKIGDLAANLEKFCSKKMK